MVENLSSGASVPEAHPPAIIHSTTISLNGKNQSPKLLTLENSNLLHSTCTDGVVAMPLHPLSQQDWESNMSGFL